MLRKDFGLSVKEVTEAGVIEGYGSTFGGKPDSYGDIVLPGAFAESLVRHKREGTMPLMLWGHQAHELPVGDWTDMAEDGTGLWLKGQIDLDDPVGQRVHRALKRKSVRGLSIGYDVVDGRRDEKNPSIRYLEKLDLWEVSPVNFPANRRATITGIKAVCTTGLPTITAFQDFLHEAGFSKSEATAIAEKGLGPLLRGEPGSDPAADYLAALGAQLRA